MLALTMNEIIYFAERHGFVKIGTTRHLPSRLKALNRGDSAIQGMTLTPVNLLTTMPGDRDVETAIHQLFAFLRYDGEWFLYDEPLVSFVQAITAAKAAASAQPMELSFILEDFDETARPQREPVVAGIVHSRTLLEDLRSIMVGQESAWSADLVSDLAERWPNRYLGWSSADLAKGLRPFGIKTVQVWRKVEGRGFNRNGLRLRDLQRAS